ncbi:L-type lectin-domain containing protein [Listeria cornellensis]|uniref:Cell surface protein n=1 Tax=Listeria cornellensis FSL F6-0969 TaxID=1265820 RepID=W7BKM3_9LIST|nr:L-type lectin-domain containing protein [Listeria cornellensis]EUJ25360.1 cell surface protein [Listeria cornellensis FSL F6-0969]
MCKKKDYDIVQITANESNKVGTIWSTELNKMDLTKDFEAKMHLYFGNEGGNAGDGMAFVIQNDPNGNNAYQNGGGARMAVWDATQQNIFGLGINNSLALEFDTFYNSTWDRAVENKNHIAWNYPGVRNTYEDKGGRALRHKDVQYPGNLSNDQWYPLTVNWTAGSKTLKYQFSDLPPISTIVDTAEIFKSDTVYWGFTGSTGASKEMNRVVFEKVPGLVEEENSLDVVETKSGESIIGKTTNSGEKLTYKIKTNYLGGKQDWKEIMLNMKVNSNLDYIPNSLKLIDKNGSMTELDDNNWNDNNITTPLNNMDKSNNIQEIQFDVITKKVATDTTITNDAELAGQNYITSTASNSFIVKSNNIPTVTLDNANEEVTLSTNQDFEIKGTWLDPDSPSVDLYYTFDNGAAQPIQEDMVNDEMGSTQAFKYKIPANLLSIGKHEVTVFAVDNLGAKSNIEKMTVQVIGELTLSSIPDQLDFGNVIISGIPEEYWLQNFDKPLIVSDTREVKGSWQLNARLSEPIANGDSVLQDALSLYRTDGSQAVLTEDFVPIAEQLNTSAEDQDISKDWDKDGKSMKLMIDSGQVKVGNYRGEIEWQLQDTPDI